MYGRHVRPRERGRPGGRPFPDSVADGFVATINGKVPPMTMVRGYIDAFFGRLMRLGRAQDQGIYVPGGYTIVVYYVPAPAVPPVGHTEPVAAARVGAMS